MQPDIAEIASRVASAAAAGYAAPARALLAAGWRTAPGYATPARRSSSNTVPYARFVEYGTRTRRPAAMLGRALAGGVAVSAPVVVQPDVEAHVWAQLAALRRRTSFAYAATQIDAARVDHGPLRPGGRPRTSDKQPARDLAEQVRQIMVGLPDVPWAEGAV